MKSNETKQKFIELRAKGLSFDKIAKELSVAKQTLINWAKEFECEIKNLKSIELEALYETYSLNKEGRIKLIGGFAKKILEELEKRNLENVPVSKLLELLSKYAILLKDEYLELHFKYEETLNQDKAFNGMLDGVQKQLLGG